MEPETNETRHLVSTDDADVRELVERYRKVTFDYGKELKEKNYKAETSISIVMLALETMVTMHKKVCERMGVEFDHGDDRSATTH